MMMWRCEDGVRSKVSVCATIEKCMCSAAVAHIVDLYLGKHNIKHREGTYKNACWCLLRQISNAWMTSGHILEQWWLTSNVVILKILNNCCIDHLYCIRLMEMDQNKILKHLTRLAMREMEKIEGFLDIKFGFRTRKTTYQAINKIK